MIELVSRARETYRSGGIGALYNEGRRYWRSHSVRVIGYAKLRALRLAITADYDAVARPTKLLSVRPARITLKTNQFDPTTDIGKIVGGEWDQTGDRFTDTVRYKAVYSRFEQGISWEETGIYDYYRQRIEEEGRYDGCYTLEDVKERYRAVGRMYESMKEDGYNESKVENRLDHVCVNIGRSGELLHAGVGNHRLAVAKVLELDELPVRVVVRHKQWQQKRERIAAGEEQLPPDPHPDLRDLL